MTSYSQQFDQKRNGGGGEETVVDLIRRGYDLRPIGATARPQASPIKERQRNSELTPRKASSTSRSPKPGTRSALLSSQQRKSSPPAGSTGGVKLNSSGGLVPQGDSAKKKREQRNGGTPQKTASSVASGVLKRGTNSSNNINSAPAPGATTNPNRVATFKEPAVVPQQQHLEDLSRQHLTGLTSPRPDLPLMTEEEYYQRQNEIVKMGLAPNSAVAGRAPSNSGGGRAASRSVSPPQQVLIQPPPAPDQPLVISDSLYKQMFLQERADRFHVERLFLEREEHHNRQRLGLEESYRLVEMVTAARHFHRAAQIEEAHENELANMQRKLEDETSVSAVRRELQSATARVNDERKIVEALQREMQGREEDRLAALDEDKRAWAAEKAGLLKQLHVLEKQVAVATGRSSSSVVDQYSDP